jgi:anti-sigma regulatory factor (Ser/Thr protein kinase)
MDLSSPALMTEILQVEDVSQIGQARRVAQHLASRLDFNEEQCGRVAIVATELATNLVKHARRGSLYLRQVPHADGHGIEVMAVDKGPGFDVKSCLADGISSSGTSGIGLGAVLRLSQVYDAYASEQGSVVMARLYRAPCTDSRIGVVHVTVEAGQPCGDTWRIAFQQGGLCALVIDGLGHGSDAAKAAALGGAAFEEAPFMEPAALMVKLNAAMSGSRGGAVAIAQYAAAVDLVRFAGIGNISAFLVNSTRSRGLASHPGIVGLQFRKVQTFDTNDVRPDLLIMHSDGIQSRWNMRSYPGLAQCHPAIVAAVIHRDFSRGRDDVTIVVIAIGAVS